MMGDFNARNAVALAILRGDVPEYQCSNCDAESLTERCWACGYATREKKRANSELDTDRPQVSSYDLIDRGR